MASLGLYIAVAEQVIEGVEQLSLYWDAKGLDMHIAVKSSGTIAVSTKHWSRVHYMRCEGICAEKAWKLLLETAQMISRTLVKSVKGPYVYIPKLNSEQTQSVFNHIKQKMNEGTEIDRVWEISWDIDDAISPPE
jgi:hypothetical protein